MRPVIHTMSVYYCGSLFASLPSWCMDVVSSFESNDVDQLLELP